MNAGNEAMHIAAWQRGATARATATIRRLLDTAGSQRRPLSELEVSGLTAAWDELDDAWPEHAGHEECGAC